LRLEFGQLCVDEFEVWPSEVDFGEVRDGGTRDVA